MARVLAYTRHVQGGAMTIAPDLVAQILRLHAVEKWRVGTIARQLHVHRDVVLRVLAGNCAPVHTSALRPSRIDAYRPFLVATLTKFPTLTAARLHAMCSERGYVGSTSHFRALVAGLRPRPSAEAYLRLRTLPGEQAQVDWGLCRARHRAQSTCAHSPGSKSSLRKAGWRRGRMRCT
jgi:hypothetical protein